MVFRRLHPITDLTGEKFWEAFWEGFRCECTSVDLVSSPAHHLCVLGHYHLLAGGIEHNDINVKNLVYDKLNKDHAILMTLI
jgi:hypothetical protein